MLRRPLFSTDAYFSLYLLANHGSHFTGNTVANIQPLRTVYIILLSLKLVLTVWIETARKGSRTFPQQQSQFRLNLNWRRYQHNLLYT